jgi:phosphopantetheine adenylyltransferase
MGAKIKPVQPTVIKDKKIIQDVIAEIHRKPTKKDLARIQERREVFKKATAR